MKIPAFFCFLPLLSFSAISAEEIRSLRRNYQALALTPRKWICLENGKCKRKIQNSPEESQEFNYIEGCKSVCDKFGSIWPLPTGSVYIKKALTAFNLEDVAIKFDAKEQDENLDEFLTESWSIFTQYLSAKVQNKGQMKASKKADVLVKISVSSKDLDLDLKTDESYSINIDTRPKSPRDELIVQLKAKTFFGIRHSLETLSQLVTFDPTENCLRISGKVKIKDEPKYPYRGILLDTSRNYYSVSSIKRVIDGLSYNKLNVLHWHINDQQSFPFVSERVPNLTRYGAYSADQVYYKDEIKGLVMYAKQRGVLLLPEFDAPAHSSQGWQFGPEANLGPLVSCFDLPWEDESGTLAAEPPAGQLNPVNDNVYKILDSVYLDFVEAFTPMYSKNALKMFHMGGDEVNFKCWAKDPNIRNWLSSQGLETDLYFNNEGYLYLWSVFQEKALKSLVKANKGQFADGVILWTSELTKPNHIAKFLDASKYIIQVWTTGSDAQIGQLLKQKYRLIMSNYDAWYLDCGFGAWLYSDSGPENNWCSPFKGWKTMYKNNFQHILSTQGLDFATYGKLILGGEATMWSEQSDEFSVETKLWPRSCAFAERLWSDPQETGWKEAEQRLLEHRHRLVFERKLHADAIMPEFCRQNDGDCYTLKKTAITFQDQLHQHAFINEPFTLSPEISAEHEAKSQHWSSQLTSLKSILLIFLIIFIVIKRRFLINSIRAVKFISIN